MEFLRKVMGEERQSEYEAAILPVKAHICKVDGQNLLNNLIMV
jgi:hypothetical protein